MDRGKNAKIGISADLARFFDAALKSRDISAEVTVNDNGTRTYAFPAGIEQPTVLEVMQEAYALREAEKQ